MKNAKGFTLIELLVVIAITGALSVFTAGILISIYQSNRAVAAVNDIKQNSEYVHSQLEYAIRNAKSVSTAGGITYPGDRLALVDSQGITTVYSLDAANNQLLKDAVTLTSSSVSVSSLNFEVPNVNGKPTVVKVNMTMSAGTSPTISLDFKTIVLARNY